MCSEVREYLKEYNRQVNGTIANERAIYQICYIILMFESRLLSTGPIMSKKESNGNTEVVTNEKSSFIVVS